MDIPGIGRFCGITSPQGVTFYAIPVSAATRFVDGPVSLTTGVKVMLAHALTPILNVSDILAGFAWFEKLGWTKGFQWGTPPTFGSVCSGKCEIFLCLGGQGGRGKSTSATTGKSSDQDDKGVWMSVWVDDVDAIHRHCLDQGIEITMPPTDEPWGVREMSREAPGRPCLPDQQGDRG